MNDDLTNDAKYLLLQMVRTYLRRTATGQSKFQATNMGSGQQIHDEVMPQWNIEDVAFTLGELFDKGFVALTHGSNQIASVRLTTDAIAWQEHKFGNDVKQIIAAISGVSKLIPLL